MVQYRIPKQESLLTGSTQNRCISYIFMNFSILYFTHGSSHSFPVFIQNNSCDPVSNPLVELKLSAWTIYRSVIYLATTDL